MCVIACLLCLDAGTDHMCMYERFTWYRCLWTNNTPSQKTTLGKMSFRSIKSGTGEQFLPLNCRAMAGTTGMFFSQTPVWMPFLTLLTPYSRSKVVNIMAPNICLTSSVRCRVVHSFSTCYNLLSLLSALVRCGFNACMQVFINNLRYECVSAQCKHYTYTVTLSFHIRPISLLKISLLRLLDSFLPANSPWAWEFHPLN